MRVSKDIFDEWMTKLEDSMDKLTSRKCCSKPAFLKVLNKGNGAELQNALWGKTEKNMKYLEAHCDLFRIQKKNKYHTETSHSSSRKMPHHVVDKLKDTK